MAKVTASVTPEVLKWARLSAGLSAEDAARKVSPRTAPDMVLAWESGEKQPTFPQLRKLADAYKRPLSLFFLPKPPKDFQPMHDFRRMPGEIANVYSPELRHEIRLANERRQLALELFAELEAESTRFSLSATLNDAPEEIGTTIRDVLNIDYAKQTQSRNRQDSFRFWRRGIEALGVLVFQAERVKLSEMLGFSIADPVLPVITVNRKSKRGRVFTLLHEFTHLMLRRSGICDLDEDDLRLPDEQRVEVFCNAVAASVLVPAQNLLKEPQVLGKGRSSWRNDELDALAERYGVSALVILRRLLTVGRITEAFYREKQADYRAIYKRLDQEERDSRGEAEILRNMPRETLGKLGSPFVRLVLDNYYRETITLNDVSDYLGVKVRHVPKIEEQLRVR